MSEQIYKQIPKQRRPQEHYEAPFPIPPLDIEETKALADLALEHIDELVGDE